MGNAFDFLIAAALVLSVIVCYNYGIFRLLIPFRKLAAFITAYSLKDAELVNGFVGKIIKADGVKAFLNKRIDNLWGDELKAAAESTDVSISDRFDGVFGFAGDIFSNLKDFCISLYEKLFSSVEITDPAQRADTFVRDALGYLTDVVASFFTTLLSFLILYIFFSFAFKYGAKLLDAMFSEGFFGLLNRCMGALVGVFYGFLICWVMSLVFVLIIPLITPIDVSSVVGGYFDLTEWFYTKFFISRIIGITL